MDEMIKQTIEALKANNIEAFYAKDTDVARDMVISMINKDDVIGAGGSMTLDQCNIRDEIRKSGYKFLDWFKADLSESEKVEILKNTLTCDVFLTGSNVITMDGKLFNVDGRGNRVAALIFGPKKVIVVAGRNKIVKDMDEARERMETVAAPLNAKKLNKITGCAKTGYCVDCNSPERICRHFVVTDMQKDDGRMNVIIVDDELGL